jgi:hypothetical protein
MKQGIERGEGGSARAGARRRREEIGGRELRAARGERIRVREGEPWGWVADSEAGGERYHLYCHPETHQLICTCGDFIFRGESMPNYECKHISATLKFIARRYLALEYDPRRRARRAA